MKRLNFRAARVIVTAMTLFATSLTASVCSADDAPTAAATAAAPIAPTAALTATVAAPTAQPAAVAIAPIATAAEPATPLQLRETHPLALAQDPATSSGWKLIGALAVMAAGAYAFKKYSDKNKPAETIRSLQVLKKLSIGVRTELIVVDVDGQRLLLGVTPSSIVTLASLPDPDQDPEPAQEVIEQEAAQPQTRFAPTYRPGEIGERSQQLGERLAALVQRSRAESEKPAADLRPDLRVTARPQRRATKKSVAPEAIEGQVRGVGKIGRIG